MTKERLEIVKDMAKRGAGYLVSMNGKGKSAFDISFAMEIFSGVPKEICMNMILEEQKNIRELKELGKKVF